MRGSYNPEEFPFNAEIFRAASPEEPCRYVTLCGGIQIGKTLIGQIIVGGYMVESPCPMMYTHPSEGNADAWVRTKLFPMIRNSPSLSECLGGKKAESNQSLIERPDGQGMLRIATAGSVNDLSMYTAFVQIQDDLSKWEDFPGTGDPEVLADGRSNGVRTAKIIKIGNPLIDPGCRITRAFKNGSREYWNVPCPHCDFLHPFQRENFQINEEHPERSVFVCPKCGKTILQRHRRDMNHNGDWFAENPEAKAFARSFHLWAAMSPLADWGLLARRDIGSRGDPKLEQVVTNEVYGLPFRVDGEAPAWEKLQTRADKSGQKRGIIPHRHPILTIGFDVQVDRVEGHIQAFGPNNQIATVDYVIVSGHISEEETCKRMDEQIRRKYRNAAGNEVGFDMVAIDGNAWTDDVMAWAKRHAKVIVIRGAKSDNAPPLELVKYERDRKGERKRRQRKWFNVGVSQLRRARYINLRKDDPLKRGYVAIPAGMGEVFFQQYTSLRRVARKANAQGFTPYVWELPAGQRKEVLDTAIYGEAAAIRVGVRDYPPERWEALIAERETPLDAPQLDMDALLARPVPVAPSSSPEQPKPAPVPPAAPKRRTWADIVAR